jgi:tRNA uridine 5-carboxymethylaminomethyl modification enzyme
LTPAASTSAIVDDLGLSSLSRPLSAYELLRRPGVSLSEINALIGRTHDQSIALSPPLLTRVEEEVKYGAFIEREVREISRRAALEHKPIPHDIAYETISGLRIEARQSLSTHHPRTFGDAGRLAGVTPADVAALLIHAAKMEAAVR